jgi:DNA end-binding protein Ku
MFHAVSKKSVSFNQLDERTLSRIRLKKVSAETGEDVPDEFIVKGYEISKGRYVIVDPDELEPFIPSATKSIDLEEFVDLDEIDPVYFDSPYILAPDKTPKPYALLAQAMESAGKVAIGRFVMRNKQYVAAVRASEGTLLMSTMVFADEVVPVDSIDELDVLDSIDAYREQVLDLIERKAAGELFETPAPAAAAPQVVDLMAALEASVKAAKAARGRHPAAGPDLEMVGKAEAPAKPRKVRKSA